MVAGAVLFTWSRVLLVMQWRPRRHAGFLLGCGVPAGAFYAVGRRVGGGLSDYKYHRYLITTKCLVLSLCVLVFHVGVSLLRLVCSFTRPERQNLLS